MRLMFSQVSARLVMKAWATASMTRNLAASNDYIAPHARQVIQFTSQRRRKSHRRSLYVDLRNFLNAQVILHTCDCIALASCAWDSTYGVPWPLLVGTNSTSSVATTAVGNIAFHKNLQLRLRRQHGQDVHFQVTWTSSTQPSISVCPRSKETFLLKYMHQNTSTQELLPMNARKNLAQAARHEVTRQTQASKNSQSMQRPS